MSETVGIETERERTGEGERKSLRSCDFVARDGLFAFEGDRRTAKWWILTRKTKVFLSLKNKK